VVIDVSPLNAAPAGRAGSNTTLEEADEMNGALPGYAGLANTVDTGFDNDARTRANPPSPPFGKGGLGGFRQAGGASERHRGYGALDEATKTCR